MAKIYPTGKEIITNTRCVGIDLGTTATLCSQVLSADVDLSKSMTIPVQHVKITQKSPNQFDNDMVDHCVASIVAEKEGKIYIGSNLYHLKGTPDFQFKKNIFYHWKLELGLDQTPVYPHAVRESLDMPYKIAGGILKYIKVAGLKERKELDHTIITVPASFQANQRSDVLKAAAHAEIKAHEGMLIDEPNAAFLGYFNSLPDTDKQVWANQVRNNNVLIVDFGGGTLDLSILNVDFRRDSGITISNIAISRYNDLGGQDIDYILAEEFLYPKLIAAYPEMEKVSLSDLNASILPQLATIGERLKIGVCKKVSMRIVDKKTDEVDLLNVEFTDTNCEIQYGKKTLNLGDITLTAKEFDDYFEKIFTPKEYKFEFQDKVCTSIGSSITEILNKAEIGLNNIHFVLFAGGSSFNPFLISQTGKKLSGAQLLTTHMPDTLVADGAAVYSYFYYVHGISLITPITNETIGVTLAGNQFFPIIERGTTLPKKTSLPDFRVQSNMNSQIVVPICINGTDFPIGEIRADLPQFYAPESIVRIDATINRDKVFEMKVFVENDFVGEAVMNNPFAMGIASEEERKLYESKSKLNQAIQKNNFGDEKKLQRDIIWDYEKIGNYKGFLENAERYLNKFDDQDEYVWNMHFIANRRLGRQEAAKDSLEKAMKINPGDETLIYNYSILIEDMEDERAALEYLIAMTDKNNFSSTGSVALRLLNLRYQAGENVVKQANKIVELHLKNPNAFSNFHKRSLLPAIFKIAGKPYSFVDPGKKHNPDDEGKYIKFSNNPVPF